MFLFSSPPKLMPQGLIRRFSNYQSRWITALYTFAFLAYPFHFLAASGLQDHPQDQWHGHWQRGHHYYQYHVLVGGFESADVSAEYVFDDQGYTIDSQLTGKGLIQSLLGIEATISATGIWTASGLRPVHFHSNVSWQGKKTAAEITFSPSKAPAYHYEPAKDGFSTDGFAEDILTGTIDIPSLSLMIARQIARNDICTLEETVFTGRHLLKINSTDQGSARLPKNHYVSTTVPVRLCQLDITKQRSKDDPKRYNKKANEPVSIDFYITQDQDKAPPYPVMINANYRAMNGKMWLKKYRYQP